MGLRSDKLRDAQADMEGGPPVLTRQTEGAMAARERPGIITYICFGLAALGVVWALMGLFSAAPGALMQGLGMAFFWGLVAWLNERMRAAQRRRREG
jgi:hypothetical protein